MNLQEIESDSRVYERFVGKVTIAANDCWEVGGHRDRNGYGFIHLVKNGRWDRERAHRYSYEIHREKIPAGLVIDHLCRNSCCANPAHLEVVTIAENNRRGNLLQRTKEYHASLSPAEKFARAKHANSVRVKKDLERKHCKKGHEVKPETTYTNPTTGHRSCKICVENRATTIARKERVAAARLANTHCKHGHLRSAENTYIDSKSGHTECKVCMYARNKIYREKRKAIRG